MSQRQHPNQKQTKRVSPTPFSWSERYRRQRLPLPVLTHPFTSYLRFGLLNDRRIPLFLYCEIKRKDFTVLLPSGKAKYFHL